MLIRFPAIGALLALLASCAVESPQPSSSSDSSYAGGAANQSPPLMDTAGSHPAIREREPGPRVLTPDGWGPLRIGMTREQVIAAAGEDAHPEAVGGPDPESCDEFRPRDAPDGVLVMMRSGVLSRISVSRNADISTPAGFSVGDSGSAVLAEYGDRAEVEPHQYWEPPAKYVTVWRDAGAGPSERRGLRYEIDTADEIVHLRGGDASIELVEGCV